MSAISDCFEAARGVFSPPITVRLTGVLFVAILLAGGTVCSSIEAPGASNAIAHPSRLSPQSGPVVATSPAVQSPYCAFPIRISTAGVLSNSSYQQELRFNSSAYSAYFNANLSNLLFTYVNGTPIDAWIQDGASNNSAVTTVWLNLSAVSNQTILLMAYPKSDSLMGNASYLGEAPDLSPIYGQDDNGPRVFPVYNDFAGSHLNGSVWTIFGSERNFSVDNGFLLGDNGYGGILSDESFNASRFSIGIDLNLSSHVYLPVQVGTYSHVRIVGGNDSRYWISDESSSVNGTFGGTGRYNFFSLWTNSTVGHALFQNQLLNITYNYQAGTAQGERISIRSDSPGWVTVHYALIRKLPTANSGYMPTSTISGICDPLSLLGLYPVSFVQAGLPSGKHWSVRVSGVATLESEGPAISVALSNGSYLYQGLTRDTNYTSSQVEVFYIAGASLTVTVRYEHVYPVTFRELGFPSGWLWLVATSAGQNASSLTSTIMMQATNGTYSFTGVASYPLAVAASGNFTVSGHAQTINVTFAVKTPAGLLQEPYYVAAYLGVLVATVLLLAGSRFSRRSSGRKQ